MQRSFADGRQWMAYGTERFIDAVRGLTSDDFDAPTLLPGWTRRHLAAHVAANGDALSNLADWAATGVETPMYASPVQRAADIERGTTMSGPDLESWLTRSAEKLEAKMAALTETQWAEQVVTAQGRTIRASETPWLRAREVCIHVVDLDRGLQFKDLPTDFLEALVHDIRAKRRAIPHVQGSLPDIAAWLAGRPHRLSDAPALDAWL